MATGDGVLYNDWKRALLRGNGADVQGAGAIKVALLTATYTPDIDAHTVYGDLTNELSGTGYTSGGAVLTGVSVTADNTNDRGKLDADNPSWSGINAGTAKWAVFYLTGTGGLIGYWDTGGIATNGGDLTLSLSANGLVLLT